MVHLAYFDITGNHFIFRLHLFRLNWAKKNAGAYWYMYAYSEIFTFIVNAFN